MGLFRAFADIVYKEYDRRVRRASLVTEYGMSHHHDHAGEEHAAEEHAAEEHAADDTADDAAEIANVPPGTPLATPTPTPTEPAETSSSHE